MSDGSDYRSRRRRGRSTRHSGASGTKSGELQTAVDRFEQAVQELVGSATSEFSDRATSFLNDTTSKLQQEFGGSREEDGDFDSERRSAADRMAARRRARYRSDRLFERSPTLCRDPQNGKIAGVCAGVANYYGVEVWIVRCIAVTGLLFLNSITFTAYWIMYFVMDDPKTQKKRGRKEAKRKSLPEVQKEASPRRNLKNVQADLSEVELRLRRMETHVTSGQYELQRELHLIDVDVPGTAR
jgi:phage shock protein C